MSASILLLKHQKWRKWSPLVWLRLSVLRPCSDFLFEPAQTKAEGKEHSTVTNWSALKHIYFPKTVKVEPHLQINVKTRGVLWGGWSLRMSVYSWICTTQHCGVCSCTTITCTEDDRRATRKVLNAEATHRKFTWSSDSSHSWKKSRFQYHGEGRAQATHPVSVRKPPKLKANIYVIFRLNLDLMKCSLRQPWITPKLYCRHE